MQVVIFGTGYVGLVAAACLAHVGNSVVCVDTDTARIARLCTGELPLYEPGLGELVVSGAAAGRIAFVADAALALSTAAVAFIAVGTPSREDGSADVCSVLAVAETIGAHANAGLTVVNKSTAPVGTAQMVRDVLDAALSRRGVLFRLDVAANPEFLKEGAAVDDFMRPDRIIIGTDAPAAIEKLRELYQPFNRNSARVIVMDTRSAELTKYAANAMLATKISFMNEIANIAETVGADVESVRIGIGADHRIGRHFIYPGAGYGGSCFPKDVRALLHSAREKGYCAELLRAVDAVNERQKEKPFALLARHFGGALAGLTIAVWGLSFKPNTDDMREAPSCTLLAQLWAAGAMVRAFDPEASGQARARFGERDDLTICGTSGEALDGADALVIVTEWPEFRSPELNDVAAKLRRKVIIDGRNMYDTATVERAGLAYYGIGCGRTIVKEVTA